MGISVDPVIRLDFGHKTSKFVVQTTKSTILILPNKNSKYKIFTKNRLIYFCGEFVFFRTISPNFILTTYFRLFGQRKRDHAICTCSGNVLTK